MGHILLSNSSDCAPNAAKARKNMLLNVQSQLYPDLKDEQQMVDRDTTDNNSTKNQAQGKAHDDITDNDSRMHETADVAQELPHIIAQRLSKDPINEFEENDTLFYGAYPDLFLFGRGLRTKGSVPNKHATYLLNHFTTKFAHDQSFIFTLFNQRVRHDGAKAVTVLAKQHPDTFLEFSKTVQSEEFRDLTKKAVVNPQGPEAAQVLSKSMNMLKLAGQSVPFSAAQRSSAMTKLYAFCQYFGCPSTFFTFAPDVSMNIF